MLLSRDHDFHEDEAIEEGRLWHVVVNGSWHWYGHNLLGSPALSCGLGNSSAVKSACFLFPNWSCDLSNFSANIQQHGVTHHFLVLGKVWPKIPWCKATWHMTPESETNLSEYVMMLCC